jgi:hypothetical protein
MALGRSPADPSRVLVKLELDGRVFEASHPSYFRALCQIRLQLEASGARCPRDGGRATGVLQAVADALAGYAG